ncbi:MAG TPA: heme-binding protein [Candidatus Hydrogenedentes bacterium]|nr:heme-binding protein [Candidatus Hydrogenedentota bacterium]
MRRRKKRNNTIWWLVGILGLLTVLCLLALWTAAGMATSRVGEAVKPLVSIQRDGYILRKYPAHTVAATVVEGERYTRAMFRGFEVLNRYISGNNDQKKRIPMTAPVLQGMREKGGGFEIAFILPDDLEGSGGAPQPGDKRVWIDRRPPMFMAVRPFSGYATSEYAAEQIAILKDLLERDGIQTARPPAVAQFDPPWTPPFMRYNEIWWPVYPPSLTPEEQEKVGDITPEKGSEQMTTDAIPSGTRPAGGPQ